MTPAIALPEEIITRRLCLRRNAEGEIEPFGGGGAHSATAGALTPAAERPRLDEPHATLMQAAETGDANRLVAAMAITLLGVGRYLGSCGLSMTAQEAVAELYFTLVQAAQGHGYATEAVEALIDFSRSWGTKRLIARVFDGNRASIGVLERAGFVLTETIEGDLGTTSLYAVDL